jgi:hypothetical protein
MDLGRECLIGGEGCEAARPETSSSGGKHAQPAPGLTRKGNIMLKVAMLALALSSVPVAVRAAEGTPPPQKRPELTEEQKKVRKELVEKYDKNKDGRLDSEERKSMSAEDKEKWSKASGRKNGAPPPSKKKEGDK